MQKIFLPADCVTRDNNFPFMASPLHLKSSMLYLGFPGDASQVKNLPANTRDIREAHLILGGEDTMEEEVATHSRIFAWRILRTEEPCGLQSMGLQRVRHDWSDLSMLACFICFHISPFWSRPFSESITDAASGCFGWKYFCLCPSVLGRTFPKSCVGWKDQIAFGNHRGHIWATRKVMRSSQASPILKLRLVKLVSLGLWKRSVELTSYCLVHHSCRYLPANRYKVLKWLCKSKLKVEWQIQFV